MSTKLLTKTQNPYKTDVYTLPGIVSISFYFKDIDPYDPFNDSRPIITFKENNEVMRIKIRISYDNSIKYEFTDFTRQN